jgi:hypothetical protein
VGESPLDRVDAREVARDFGSLDVPVFVPPELPVAHQSIPNTVYKDVPAAVATVVGWSQIEWVVVVLIAIDVMDVKATAIAAPAKRNGLLAAEEALVGTEAEGRVEHRLVVAQLIRCPHQRPEFEK